VLLILFLMTTAYALMVWRTEWIVSKLFPGQTAPVVGPGDGVIALTSGVLAIVLTGVWIRSLLASGAPRGIRLVFCDADAGARQGQGHRILAG